MNRIVQIILIILFFLQGVEGKGAYVAIFLILLVTTLLTVKEAKIRLPNYFLLAIIVYSFYLMLGLYFGHANAQIDIKFQFFLFTFYFWLINQKFQFDFLRLLFQINIITFIIYVLIYLDIIPSIWNIASFGSKGRVYGPVIIPIILIGFYYLYRQRPFDFKLAIASIFALVYILLTSSLMNLGITALLLLLVVVDFRRLFKLKYISIVVFLLLIFTLYLNSPWVPEIVSVKMKYVFKPWEYGTIQTRIQDLDQALKNEDFGIFKTIFGEGFGTSSEILRENRFAQSLTKTFLFLEIDNGFYYIYHRGGLSLLAIFILSHIYLIYKCPNNKSKLGFFIIFFLTNLISIQYFNYLFYMLVPYIILEQKKDNVEN